MTDIRQELLEKAKAMGIKLTAQQAESNFHRNCFP